MAAGTHSGGGETLSLVTLVVAALASGAAALLVSQFSESGSAMAAALTAVFVPLLREAFHRPTKALSGVRPGRGSSFRSGDGGGPAGAAAGAGAVLGAAKGADDPTARLGSATAPTRAGAAGGPRTHELDPSTRPLGEEGPPARDEWDGRGEGTTDFLGAGAAPADMLESDPRGVGGDGPDDATQPLDAATTPLEPSTRRLADRDGRPLARAGAAAGASAGRRPGAAMKAPGARRALGRRPRVRIAVLTGLLAFLIAAVVITVPELIAGDSIGGGKGRTTFFSGGSGSIDSNSRDGAGEGTTDGGSGAGEGGGSSDPVPGGGGASEGSGGGSSGGGETPAPDSGSGGAKQSKGGGGSSNPAPSAPPSGKNGTSP